MEKICIRGGQSLNGSIPISGAKNAALPLMIASLLTHETLRLSNVPKLRDVHQLKEILTNHGVDYAVNGKRKGQTNGLLGETLKLTANTIVDTTAPYKFVSKMRASFWVIGPLVARMHEARVSLPGGCAIGTRPVDFFISGLKTLGAEIDIEAGYVLAKAPQGLRGDRIVFPDVSVGATHTLMMAACLARGETVIENAAQEPEICNVAECLVKMGAKIEGAGTSTLYIQGVDQLYRADHTVVCDRIESGTFAMAVAATGGDVLLEGANAAHLRSVIEVLKKANVTISERNDGIRVSRNGARLKATDIETTPFPGFPTDLQAQFMALMTQAEGTSHITETIFENRFMHVQELNRLGAHIHHSGQKAVIVGNGPLKGAPVMATDLRASVSLVIAALCAQGETEINRVYHLDRGFERLEEKLSACGALIRRETA